MSPIIILPEYNPTPFDPDSVAGLIFWHDFSDTSTLWQDTIGGTPVALTGDPVLVAQDKSSSFIRNLVNSGTVPVTWDSAGQNGLGALKIHDVAAGGFQHMQHTAALVQPAPLTYFIAATTPYNTTVSVLTAQNGCGGALFGYWNVGGSGIVVTQNDGGGGPLVTSLPFATFTSVTIELDVTTTVWNGTSVDVVGNAGYLGGTAQSAHRLGGWCNANLSGQDTSPGPTFVGEVLEYAGALAPADVTAIQNYLINKWGA